MSQTVFKYDMPIQKAKYQLLLPRGFKFLRVGFQNEKLFMWAQVTKDIGAELYDFVVVGTGHEVPAGAKYLTTYDYGPYVFHLYCTSSMYESRS